MSLNVLTQGGGAGGETASIFVTGLDENSEVKAVQKIPVNGSVKLPDGYTQLECIQGTGAQYFSTGFNPKYNTRLVMEVSDVTASLGTLFGVRASGVAGDSTSFALLVTGSTNSLRSDYFGTAQNFTVPNLSQRTIIDKNCNSVTLYGQTITHTSVSSGSSSYELDVFALNTKGTHEMFGRFKMYSCQIYDGDTLVRHYIPAKRNSDGAIGVYDLVNQEFTQSATSTAFIAGNEIPQYVDGKTVQGKWNSAENRFEISKIKEYGMWTVTATNGEDTVTQDVLVDAAVEFEIEMDLYKLWLYREGDECEDVTGGFSAYARKNWSGGIATAPTLTKNADSMSVALNINTSDNRYRGIVSTNALIHIEEYKKLKIHCPTVSVSNAADMAIAFYVTTSINDDFNQYVLKAYDITSGTNTTDTLVEIDVSGISADAYAVINMIGWTNCTVDKIWLE